MQLFVGHSQTRMYGGGIGMKFLHSCEVVHMEVGKPVGLEEA